ncbi:MAG TPA: hypothetical protein VMJ10_34720 [Kofleriaceae bacterium]|nr:hypothetical protein [Kofleriaceae bacterium]
MTRYLHKLFLIATALTACEHESVLDRVAKHEMPEPQPQPTPAPQPQPTRPGGGTTMTLDPGALIIPTGSAYQDECGAVSTFGLVYDVLRANTWLAANGYSPITVHYAYNSEKFSPNRCVPTNLDTPPSPHTAPYTTDPKWNDGCDFRLQNALAAPATQIDNTQGYNSAKDIGCTAAPTPSNSNACKFSTFNTSSDADVHPGYSNRTVTHPGTTVNNIGFLGGPFVIQASDAQLFTWLLAGKCSAADGKKCSSAGATFIAKDPYGNNIDFSPFRCGTTGCTGSFPVQTGSNYGQPSTVCSGSEYGLNGVNPSPPHAPTQHHLVRVFRANHTVTVPASLDDNRQLQNTPPRLALLSYFNALKTGDPTKKITSNVTTGILEQYLTNAGLDFNGAQGCPVGGYNAGNSAICPHGATPGQIYDYFDFADLKNNLETNVDANGNPYYAAVWAPHWDSYASSFSPPTGDETTAISDLYTWLDSQTSGFMAECASIESIEGAYAGASAYNEQTTPFLTTGGSLFGITRDSNELTDSGNLHNCNDPDASTTSECAYFGYPGDPYSQMADYMWHAPYGRVNSYLPNASQSSSYIAGVSSLVSEFSRPDNAKTGAAGVAPTPTLARSSTKLVYDYLIYGFKQSNTSKGGIHYLAGHDQTSYIGGNLAVLQTLLQLGNQQVTVTPTNTEVSRGTPVLATINNTAAIVQGTFESIVPAPAVPKVNSDTDVATWTFPYNKGHVRAYPTANITTTVSSFNSEAAMFDAATEIPPANISGCASHYTASCRTVFTTVTANCSAYSTPCTQYYLDNSSDRATAGLPNLIANGLNATNQTTVISKIMAGSPSGGSYVPALGGIDRSTPAVIGPSTIAGGARPTMIYVGGTDGMLHAFCGSITGPCDQLGRELWAYLPRTVLPNLRYNDQTLAVVQGSAHVIDALGDFYNTGSPSYRTILTFQTGGGTPGTAGQTPAVYALDITDPTAPHVLWEYTTPAVRGNYELGIGMRLAAGSVQNVPPSGLNKIVTVAQTNNGGVLGAGDVVTAIDTETGLKLWQVGYQYPVPPRVSGTAVPGSGVPGGAVGIDKTGAGFMTDVVYGDLYGDVWELSAKDGTTSLNVGSPLFSATTNGHPFGAQPAIYNNGGQQYAVLGTGGYFDPSDGTSWASGTQFIVSIRLSPTVTTTLNESSGSPNVPIELTLAANQNVYSEVLIVGTQFFATTDTTDVNNAAYGTTGAPTGMSYSEAMTGGAAQTQTIVGGAASIVANSTTLYSSSAAGLQQLNNGATSTTGTRVSYDGAQATVSRSLWLRSE